MVAVIVVEVELGVGSYSVSSIIVVSRIGPETYSSCQVRIGPGKCAGHPTHERSRKLLRGPNPNDIELVWSIVFHDLNLENYC